MHLTSVRGRLENQIQTVSPEILQNGPKIGGPTWGHSRRKNRPKRKIRTRQGLAKPRLPALNLHSRKRPCQRVMRPFLAGRCEIALNRQVPCQALRAPGRHGDTGAPIANRSGSGGRPMHSDRYAL